MPKAHISQRIRVNFARATTTQEGNAEWDEYAWRRERGGEREGANYGTFGKYERTNERN